MTIKFMVVSSIYMVLDVKPQNNEQAYDSRNWVPLAWNPETSRWSNQDENCLLEADSVKVLQNIKLPETGVLAILAEL